MPDDTCELLVGADQPIYVDKVFGPRVFNRLRITARLASNAGEHDEWIIEQEGDDESKGEEWIEMVRIPATPEDHGTYTVTGVTRNVVG